MRFSLLPLLIAGAGLVQHASASPIRIVVTEVTNMRFGHAVANAHGSDSSNAPFKPHMMITSSITQLDDAGRPKKQHRPCGGSRLKNKAITFSNTLRKALGWQTIDPRPNYAAVKTEDGGVRIVALPPGVDPKTVEGKKVYHHRFHHYGRTFMARIHRALMSLGPWEGRAVAFVLGCGIGVLLRMFWVLSVVTYRMIRGQREEEPEYTELVFERDAEELVVPPPQYTDEKVAQIESKPATA